MNAPSGRFTGASRLRTVTKRSFDESVSSAYGSVVASS